MRPAMYICRTEYGNNGPHVTTAVQYFDSDQQALSMAHKVALEDSRDSMGSKSDIPFNKSGEYIVVAYWGKTIIRTNAGYSN